MPCEVEQLTKQNVRFPSSWRVRERLWPRKYAFRVEAKPEREATRNQGNLRNGYQVRETKQDFGKQISPESI